MGNGFTYRGRHCEEFGCCYVPSPAKIRDRMERYSVSSIQTSGRDGSYYVGATVDEREFELECFFEELDESTYAEMMEWLRRDCGGELVFDDRPYVVYDVWPSKSITPDVYFIHNKNGKVQSGKLKISLTAYQPFGRIRENVESIVFASDICVLPTQMETKTLAENAKSLQMHNCGTEVCSVIVRLSGDVGEAGLTITNTTNGSKCKIIGLALSATGENGWLEINGETGQVYIVIGEEKRLAYEYHDLGFIKLDPCTPFLKDVFVSYETGSRLISGMDVFRGVKKGQYIWQENTWKLISNVVDESHVEINAPAENTGSAFATITTMNWIELSGDFTLTKLEFEPIPKTR